MTCYSTALDLLGLSQAQAAKLHNVRVDTVKHWCSGRARVPAGAWNDLREAYAAVERKAKAMAKSLKAAAAVEPAPDEVLIDLADADWMTATASCLFALRQTLPIRDGETERKIAERIARKTAAISEPSSAERSR
jgi:predicted RecB family nuclease